MRKIVISSAIVLLMVALVYGGTFDMLKDAIKLPSPQGGSTAPDQGTAVSGLKQALSIGTEKAVASVSQKNGYFGNQMIKILLPEKIQIIANVAGKMGYQAQVDELIISMNRAAEAAAPKAKGLFVQAIKEMSFDDARGILQGGDTAATEFFKRKTSSKLYNQFKPVVTASMNKVGVARAYKNMITPVQSVPFLQKDSTDLDHYVTNKALDGLFLMVGEEEKKIRTDPAARVTDLLKTVFGK